MNIERPTPMIGQGIENRGEKREKRTSSTADRQTDKVAGNAPTGLFHGRPAWRRMERLARTHTFPALAFLDGASQT